MELADKPENNAGKKFLVYWLPPLAYMVIIFILSHMMNPPVPKTDIPSFDKVYHIVEYAILGFLLKRALDQAAFVRIYGYGLATFMAVSIGVYYGILDEVHQYFIPKRECSFWDLVFDASGILLGVLIYYKRIWGKPQP